MGEQNSVTRNLTYTRIATTENSSDPVVRAGLDDTGSYLKAIIAEDEDIIRVGMVKSKHRGDMKLMLDSMTRQLDTTTVWFLNPLGKELGSDLEDRLHGFEEQTVDVESEGLDHPDEITVLAGEWDPDRE